MKQIVVLSGKGGTGKTTISSMLAYEIAKDKEIKNPIFADADVDASNLELIFSPEIEHKEYFSGGKVAVFNPEHCINCQKCVHLCRFEALSVGEGTPPDIQVDEIACEGCGLCTLACPRGSLTMQPVTDGEWYQSNSRFGTLIHAQLYPGAENSGKLVTQVRQTAARQGEEKDADLLLIDGPPGIGCPVIAAVTGVDAAILVTEPTLSGLHDLQRIYQTVTHFSVPAMVILNKADLSMDAKNALLDFCTQNDIPVIAEIPFSRSLIDAVINAAAIQEFHPQDNLNDTFSSIWKKVKSIVFETIKE